jgi:Iap family predicted aminopeptidase
LQPGKDFLVGPESASFDAASTLQQMDSTSWISADRKVMVELSGKLTWSVATRQQQYTRFEVRKEALPTRIKKLSATVDANFIPSFHAKNIIASIPGARVPDSTIIFTAHYDHLGMMGDAIFPGANDNASGTAFMLALAKQISLQPLDYTVVFIFFAGEEAGLVGSSFYVSNPVYPLGNIRFLLNFDLMGNGEEGITVVNATVFENEFKLLQEINNKDQYLVAIHSRGKAQNSDHYFFTEKGVPSFFWYTLGKRKAYHDVDDNAATVPLYEANDLLQLALQFSKQVISLPRK